MNITGNVRRIGNGTFAGYYRAHLVTTEFNAWGARYVTRYAFDIVRPTREDARIDCETGIKDLESTAYPHGFSVTSSRHIPHGF